MSSIDPDRKETAPQGESASEADAKPATDEGPAGDGEQSAELETLRGLLIAPERSALIDLHRRLDTPAVRTREMAHYLPDAIHLRSGDDQRLGQALQPTVEQALQQSVRRNPKQIVEAIFPVMGPAIRRAIVSTLMGMIQSFNKVIDHTFTLRGIRWRIEALTTGRSFAEVVLLHTLIYQVEQIFLIHRATGLVLEHVVPAAAITQDPDLISSMLTAIQDFVRDSFDAQDDEGLNTLRMGADSSIWIEQGARIGLAAVIRGTPPVALRSQLREVVESVQVTHAAQIEAFAGDNQGFADLRPRLETCLQASFNVEERRLSPLTFVLLLCILGAVVVGLIWGFNRERHWQAFIADLNARPGVAVTGVEKQSGQRHIHGLRDPLAADPQALLTEAKLPADKVIWHWRTYHDLAPEFIQRRINERLKPPKSVHLTLEGGRLKMTGFARHRWITSARQAALGIAGVTTIDDAGLKDLDLIEAHSSAERLAAKTIYFALGSVEIDADNAEILVDVVATLHRLAALSDRTGIDIHLIILGHTDESGTRDKNLLLGQRRAAVVREHLVSEGVPPQYLNAIGVSSRLLRGPSTPEDNRELRRSVTFQLTINS
jgi:OOP family OmpA-OmpF porin